MQTQAPLQPSRQEDEHVFISSVLAVKQLKEVFTYSDVPFLCISLLCVKSGKEGKPQTSYLYPKGAVEWKWRIIHFMGCQNTHIMVTDDNHPVRKGKSWVIHFIWSARSSCETCLHEFCSVSCFLSFSSLCCFKSSLTVFFSPLLSLHTLFSQVCVPFFAFFTFFTREIVFCWGLTITLIWDW